MRRRQHNGRRGRPRRIQAILVSSAILALLLGGAAFAGYRYDRATAATILPGVSVAGVDLGGMTRSEAERALAPVAGRIVDRSISVLAAGKRWVLSPRRLGTKVRVEAALDEAFALSDSMSWTTRAFHRLLNRPLGKRITIQVTHSRKTVARFIGRVAEAVKVSPRDATRDFANGKLLAEPSAPGRELRDGKSATQAVLGAVQGTRDTVHLRTRSVPPTVSEQDLGPLIVIRVSQNRLHLYDGFKLARSYDVATGTPGYPTPLGHFSIINKREHPTWVNPAVDGWGRDLPAVIPPGPGNPLGTRALDLDAPGIRIHGTYDDLSIGSYASHGCVRMHIAESEQLFELVPVGTPVIITS